MHTLPLAALNTGCHVSSRLPRDRYVPGASSDHSVHPAAVGPRAEVHADHDRMVVTCVDSASRLKKGHPCYQRIPIASRRWAVLSCLKGGIDVA